MPQQNQTQEAAKRRAGDGRLPPAFLGLKNRRILAHFHIEKHGTERFTWEEGVEKAGAENPRDYFRPEKSHKLPAHQLYAICERR